MAQTVAELEAEIDAARAARAAREAAATQPHLPPSQPHDKPLGTLPASAPAGVPHVQPLQHLMYGQGAQGLGQQAEPPGHAAQSSAADWPLPLPLPGGPTHAAGSTVREYSGGGAARATQAPPSPPRTHAYGGDGNGGSRHVVNVFDRQQAVARHGDVHLAAPSLDGSAGEPAAPPPPPPPLLPHPTAPPTGQTHSRTPSHSRIVVAPFSAPAAPPDVPPPAAAPAVAQQSLSAAFDPPAPPPTHGNVPDALNPDAIRIAGAAEVEAPDGAPDTVPLPHPQLSYIAEPLDDLLVVPKSKTQRSGLFSWITGADLTAYS
eukprot:338779-Chlamydomonas_euryale.AAC.1